MAQLLAHSPGTSRPSTRLSRLLKEYVPGTPEASGAPEHPTPQALSATQPPTPQASGASSQPPAPKALEASTNEKTL